MLLVERLLIILSRLSLFMPRGRGKMIIPDTLYDFSTQDCFSICGQKAYTEGLCQKSWSYKQYCFMLQLMARKECQLHLEPANLLTSLQLYHLRNKFMLILPVIKMTVVRYMRLGLSFGAKPVSRGRLSSADHSSKDKLDAYELFDTTFFHEHNPASIAVELIHDGLAMVGFDLHEARQSGRRKVVYCRRRSGADLFICIVMMSARILGNSSVLLHSLCEIVPSTRRLTACSGRGLRFYDTRT